MDQLKPPPEMDFSTTGHTILPERWLQWKQTMQLFIELTMKGKSEKEKCSTFLYTIGQTSRDVYNTMTYLEEEQDKIDILFSKFKAYCKPNNQALLFQYTCTRQTGNYRSIHDGTETHC